MDLKKILTEQVNKGTKNIDEMDSMEICKTINNEDKKVAKAVEKTLPQIAEGIDAIVEAVHNGGRLIYIGAGTSGRLGILDAVECPPTYSTDSNLVQGLLAGGYEAFFQAKEGAEDSEELAMIDLKKIGLTFRDILVGIAASGRTPYVLGGLKYAQSIGAKTIGIACSSNSKMSKMANIMIEVLTGPEVITGSTRMKAGTAQKLVLNMLSTGTMIKLGKTYGNLMVDVKASNEKLKIRALNILMEVTGCSKERGEELLQRTDGKVKLAIVIELLGIELKEAENLLENHKGKLRSIIG